MTKKLQIPAGTTATPEFVRATRDNIDVITGRKGGKTELPALQNLTFSATPTQAQCQALNSYVNSLIEALQALVGRIEE